MENKINIAELLKDCPEGMDLDCAMYDNVQFDIVQDGNAFPIKINTPEGRISLSKYGCYSLNPQCKCVIFPKGKTTWEGFHRPFVDGDIVAIDSAGGSQVFIFEEYIRGDYAHCYLMLDDNGAVDLERGDYYVERFASREEQERLFEAIKEKGYRWDPVNDTLEKLIEPKFKVGDKVLWNYDTKKTCTISKVTLTENRGYVYCIDSDGCSSGWWGENELTPIPNKFDISTLKPFDKVLARDNDSQKWGAELFSFYDNESEDYRFQLVGVVYARYCIPYEGNEHLLGKCDECDEFYKNW